MADGGCGMFDFGLGISDFGLGIGDWSVLKWETEISFQLTLGTRNLDLSSCQLKSSNLIFESKQMITNKEITLQITFRLIPD